MTLQQKRILKYLSDSPKSNKAVKEKFNLSDDKFLELMGGNDIYSCYDCITFSDNVDECIIKINTIGQSIVDDWITDRYRFRIPLIIDTILSVSAIIISVFALLKP